MSFLINQFIFSHFLNYQIQPNFNFHLSICKPQYYNTYLPTLKNYIYTNMESANWEVGLKKNPNSTTTRYMKSTIWRKKSQHIKKKALVPNFLGSAMDPQQTSQDLLHVFFSAIPFYLKSYSVFFLIDMLFLLLLLMLFLVFLYFFPFPQLESIHFFSLVH